MLRGPRRLWLPLLLADPERLQQVMINVLSNAVKFSPEGGAIEVELRHDDGSAHIVVCDHGVGIKSEFLPYVFDRLRQGASTNNRGLGLGHWIVRDNVERPGGTVTAASDGEGKGAEFAGTESVFPANLPDELADRMKQVAINAFQALRLRDYARVDLRVTDSGKIYVIEVNPNCYLEAKSEFATAALKHGLEYPALLNRIVELASARYSR